MSVTNVNPGVKIGNVGIALLTLTAFSAVASDLIYLAVSQWSATDRIPTATFNTVQNFTVHSTQSIADGSGTRRLTVFKLVAPTSTVADIVVSWAGVVDEAVAGADTWLGTNQVTPLGTAVVATSAGGVDQLSVDVTTAVGNVIHDSYSGSADGALQSATTQTLRWREWAAMFTTEGGGASALGTGGPVTMNWNTIGFGGAAANIRIVLIGVPINAAAAASGGGGNNEKLQTYTKNTLSATSNDLTTNILQKIAAVSVTGSDRRTPQLKSMIVSAGSKN